MKTYRINLKDLNHPKDLFKIFKKLDIDAYNYKITAVVPGFSNMVPEVKVLKEGQSADLKSCQGERIYRQAGCLTGWPNNFKLSDEWSGSDIDSVAQDFKQRYGFELDRNLVSIDIIDMSAGSSNPNLETRKKELSKITKDLEKQRIREHLETYGELPMGNKDFSSLLAERAYRNSRRLSKFIEFI